MIRISFQQLESEFLRVLQQLGFDTQKAQDTAKIYTENSCAGVNSHGINRFPLFVEYVKEGLVKKDTVATLENQLGAIEQWNGNLAPGVLNATFCMDRAIALADENGIGCVALNNTNHWMRGGTYGWQAAGAGCIGICFTNTIANMPPWGGTEPRLGNNPLVIAVPRKEGHLVLDMAMSQYAYGKLNSYRLQHSKLPVVGGYDTSGNLTDDPAEIMDSMRPLPVGFWKGSALSMMLDVLVTVLSKGKSTAQVTETGKEYGISQVFICLKSDEEANAALIDQIIAYTKSSAVLEGAKISYPGENVAKTRAENLKNGIWVDETAWEKLLSL